MSERPCRGGGNGKKMVKGGGEPGAETVSHLPGPSMFSPALGCVLLGKCFDVHEPLLPHPALPFTSLLGRSVSPGYQTLGGHSSDQQGQRSLPGGTHVLMGEQQAMNKSSQTPGGGRQALPSAGRSHHPGGERAARGEMGSWES